MRVLYFSLDYTTHDRRFLSKLAESQHDVWFLRLGDNGVNYEQRPLPNRIHTVDWQAGQQPATTPEGLLQLMPEFERVLGQLSVDLVHAGPVQSCGLITALAGFHPFLVMSWGSDILVDADRNEMWNWATRYTLERSDALVCDCEAVRAKVKQFVPYPDERIFQFPWGIDLGEFSPGADSSGLRKRLGWENSFVVLSTRSWSQIYRIDVLLEAFRLAYTQCPKLRLVLLGDGSLTTEIQRFIGNHQLDDVVYRPGIISQEKMPNYFRAADLYLSCAHSDGTSVSLLEAMAVGLPVVVTDGPGNREWVVSGENGWLAPTGDADIFAQSLLLAAHAELDQRERISRANRKIAEARANWQDNFGLLLKAYDRIEAEYAR